MATIVIMPGGFHPFHAGHYALYRSAVEAFPNADVYVAATNDTSARPFPFPVKEKLAKLAGVAPNRFVQVKSPFKAEEITTRYNPLKDTLIFVRSDKDAGSLPQPGGTKRDGSPSYLQPLAGQKQLEPFAKHAYMAYLPTVEFGPGMKSATEIRSAWPRLNEKRKTALVMSLYPRTQGNAKLAATVVGLLDAAIGTQDVAEGTDKYGFHTSVSKGKFLPSKYGQDENNLYLHDLMNVSGDGSGPQLVTIDAKRIATELAAMYGGYVERTGMGTYRVYQPKGMRKSVKQPELTGVAEGSRIKTPSGMYRDQHTGVAYSKPTGQDGHDSYMTPAYMLDQYKKRLAQIAAGPYKRPKEVAQLQSRIAKLEKQGVAEGLGAEEYKQKLLSSLPQMMRFYEKNVQGWKPSQEQMLAAVETGYTVMKHTGDVKQAGKAVMDELNTLHRMSQGQGVAEGWKEKVGAAALAGAVATGAGANTPKVPLDKAIQQATAVYNINKAVKKHKEKEAEKRKSDEKQVKEENKSAIERDPELKQAMQYAKQHYPEFANDPELAYQKWVQRSLQHGKEDDQKQFELLQGLAGKVKKLEQLVIAVRNQRQQQQNEDYINESKK